MKTYIIYIRKFFISYLITSFVVYTSPLPYAYANPQGGVVGAGSANIAESGKNLTVTQTSDKAVIDWRSFNIEADEATRFNQPSSSSMTLNRVNDMNPSHIFGGLSANGNIMLLNPNGVLFGRGSRVDVNGLVATTANISNENFMNGNMTFNSNGSNASAAIINEGVITAADAGLVGLVAPNVSNHGVINARLGKVHMASGDSFTLDMYGDGLVGIGISDNVHSQIVENTGVVNAAGGVIQMTAAAGREVVNSLINVSGELHAPAVSQKNGRIYIFAEGSNAVAGNVAANKGVKSGQSTVMVSGEIDAAGYNAGENGGQVGIVGDRVALLRGSKIDASGDIGGGTVLIGGDRQGQGETPNAMTTIMQDGASIKADAVTNGNGGKVILWSDGYTDFSGAISVKGGANAGNGGFVETSGHILVADGTVVATSPYGTGGTWLLDPRNVTISADNDSGDLASDSGTPDIFTPHSDDTVINVGTITGQLNAGTSVIITTGSDGTQDGNITVNSSIQKTGANTATLTLQADNAIIINNSSIYTDGTTGNVLNVILDADHDANHTGYIYVSNSTINTHGGSLTMGGGVDPTTGYAYAGSDWWNGNGVTINNSGISTGAGNIIINGYHDSTGRSNDSSAVSIGGGSMSTTSGSITINGYLGDGGTWNNRGVILGGTFSTDTGNINITGHADSFDGNGNQYTALYIGGWGTSVTSNSGTITLAGTANSTASYSKGVIIGDTASITNGSGDIIISGYSTNSSAGQNSVGVTIGRSTISTTAGGDITITGESAKTSSSGSTICYANSAGICMGWDNGDTAAISTTTGNITLTGTGVGSAGITILNSYSSISTASGTISLTGNSNSQSGILVGSDSQITSTSTGNINLTNNNGNFALNTISSGGNLTVYSAGDISTAGDITKTGASASTFEFDAVGSIVLNRSLTSNSGVMNVVMASNYNDTGAGAIIVSGATITTNGGYLTMGGTSDPTTGYAYGLLVNDGAPYGFNWSRPDYADGIYITYGSQISTGAGNIIMNGHKNNDDGSYAHAGVNIGANNTSISTTSGSITIHGVSSNSAAGGYIADTGVAIAYASLSTGSGNIDITGTAYGSEAVRYGIMLGNASITSTSGNITMTGNNHSTGDTAMGLYAGATTITTGSGDITLAGHSYSTQTWANSGVILGGETVVSTTNGGDISITGTSTGSAGGAAASTVCYASSAGICMGWDSNSNVAVTTTTGNITFNGNGVGGAGAVISGENVAVSTSSGAISVTGSSTATSGILLGSSSHLTSTSNNISLANNTGNLALNTITAGGNLTVSSVGNITDGAANAITGTSSFTTSGSNNTIALSQASTYTGAISLNTTGSSGDATLSGLSGNLILGASTVGGAYSVTTSGSATFSDDVTAGTIFARTTGTTSDINISSGAVLTETANSGNSLTLVAGRNFVNSGGSGALVTTGTSRWLIYSTNPTANTMNNLTGYSKLYNKTYDNYAPASVTQSGNMTIYSYAPTLTVTATSVSKYYGDTNPTLTGTITGLVSGDSVSDAYSGSASFITGATQTSNVGSYAITAAVGSLTSASGYQFNYVNSTLAVNQAPLTITAASTSKTYGSSDPTLAYSYSGLKNSDTITGALSRVSGNNAGTYAINQGTISVSSNYSLSYTVGYLTITPAALTITSIDTSRVSGNENPTFTYNYSALKNNDTSSVFSGALSSLATSGSAAGTYSINAGTLSAGSNYTISYTGGTLTVISATAVSSVSKASTVPTTTTSVTPAVASASFDKASSLIKFTSSDFQSSLSAISVSAVSPVSSVSSVSAIKTSSQPVSTVSSAVSDTASVSVDKTSLSVNSNTLSEGLTLSSDKGSVKNDTSSSSKLSSSDSETTVTSTKTKKHKTSSVLTSSLSDNLASSSDTKSESSIDKLVVSETLTLSSNKSSTKSNSSSDKLVVSESQDPIGNNTKNEKDSTKNNNKSKKRDDSTLSEFSDLEAE